MIGPSATAKAAMIHKKLSIGAYFWLAKPVTT